MLEHRKREKRGKYREEENENSIASIGLWYHINHRKPRAMIVRMLRVSRQDLRSGHSQYKKREKINKDE